MKIKTSELIGPALDWAVAECLDYVVEFEGYYDDEQDREIIIRLHGPEVPGRYAGNTEWHPSADWSQGGPIIHQNHIGIFHDDGRWYAVNPRIRPKSKWLFSGPDGLVAAMRAYVAYKLGKEVEVPEELMESTQRSEK